MHQVCKCDNDKGDIVSVQLRKGQTVNLNQLARQAPQESVLKGLLRNDLRSLSLKFGGK